MKGYLAVFKARFLAIIQYRAAAFAGLSTQVFWGWINVFIFSAFYAQGSSAPISLDQAIQFIWINQAFLQLIPWNVDRELVAQIRSGNIAYELIRPLNLYGLFFSRSLAHRLIPTLLRCIPLFVLAGFFFDLHAPVSFMAGAAFVISCGFSLLLSTAITTILVMSMFWTIAADGIIRLAAAVSLVLSGLVVPLPLFPDWMKPFLDVQPFRGILDIPCRLYVGTIAVQDALYYMGFQLAWATLFVLLGKWLMDRAHRKLVIQGG